MRYSEQSLPVGVVPGPVSALEADVLVVVAFEGEGAALAASFDHATDGRVAAAFESREPSMWRSIPCPCACSASARSSSAE